MLAVPSLLEREQFDVKRPTSKVVSRMQEANRLVPASSKNIRVELTVNCVYAHACTHIYLFTIMRGLHNKVMASECLLMVRMAPLWPQKELFRDFLSLLVLEPRQLPLLLNLLVQSHI